MNKGMHENKILNLLSLSTEDRYTYFIRHCADFEQVWGLVVGEDNWVIFKDNEGDKIFPLWPHIELAELYCFEKHKKLGAKPQAINLEAFIQKCIPDMISGGVYFGAFYDGNRQGLVVTGDKLRWDLIEEINLVWE